MLKFPGWLAVVFCALFAVFEAQSSGDFLDDAELEKTIKVQMRVNFPEVKIDKIAKGPMGLYSITSGSVVMFISPDTRYLFMGSILDLNGPRDNISEEVRKKQRLNILSRLDANSTVVYEAKNEKHRLVVFIDVDCVYSRRFHRNIARLNDLGITIIYVTFPRSGINSKSYEKSISVWCSDDPKGAMNYALYGGVVDKIACSRDAMVDNLQVAYDLSVTGTPSLVMPDGTVMPGYIEPEDLLELLQNERFTKNAHELGYPFVPPKEK